MSRLVVLIAATMTFWLLVAVPARYLGGGDLAVLYATIAGLLCLVPATATLLWAELAFRHSPENHGLVIMAGGVVRMFFVALATFFLYAQFEFFHRQSGFILWVCVFYLFVLTLETILVAVARKSLASGPQNPASGGPQPPEGTPESGG